MNSLPDGLKQIEDAQVVEVRSVFPSEDNEEAVRELVGGVIGPRRRSLVRRDQLIHGAALQIDAPQVVEPFLLRASSSEEHDPR